MKARSARFRLALALAALCAGAALPVGAGTPAAGPPAAPVLPALTASERSQGAAAALREAAEAARLQAPKPPKRIPGVLRPLADAWNLISFGTFAFSSGRFWLPFVPVDRVGRPRTQVPAGPQGPAPEDSFAIDPGDLILAARTEPEVYATVLHEIRRLAAVDAPSARSVADSMQDRYWRVRSTCEVAVTHASSGRSEEATSAYRAALELAVGADAPTRGAGAREALLHAFLQHPKNPAAARDLLALCEPAVKGLGWKTPDECAARTRYLEVLALLEPERCLREWTKVPKEIAPDVRLVAAFNLAPRLPGHARELLARVGESRPGRSLTRTLLESLARAALTTREPPEPAAWPGAVHRTAALLTFLTPDYLPAVYQVLDLLIDAAPAVARAALTPEILAAMAADEESRPDTGGLVVRLRRWVYLASRIATVDRSMGEALVSGSGRPALAALAAGGVLSAGGDGAAQEALADRATELVASLLRRPDGVKHENPALAAEAAVLTAGQIAAVDFARAERFAASLPVRTRQQDFRTGPPLGLDGRVRARVYTNLAGWIAGRDAEAGLRLLEEAWKSTREPGSEAMPGRGPSAGRRKFSYGSLDEVQERCRAGRQIALHLMTRDPAGGLELFRSFYAASADEDEPAERELELRDLERMIGLLKTREPDVRRLEDTLWRLADAVADRPRGRLEVLRLSALAVCDLDPREARLFLEKAVPLAETRPGFAPPERDTWLRIDLALAYARFDPARAEEVIGMIAGEGGRCYARILMAAHAAVSGRPDAPALFRKAEEALRSAPKWERAYLGYVLSRAWQGAMVEQLRPYRGGVTRSTTRSLR